MSLLGFIEGKCGEGCLKCLENDHCFFCDFSNYFFNYEGSCIHKEIKNCEQFSISGSCLRCNPGFYLDENTKCVQVFEVQQIENCEYYFSARECIECKVGYKINLSSCIKPENFVENCLNYSQQSNLCQECVSGFQLIDSQCVKIPQKNNCQVYSTLKCIKCKTGSYADLNYYTHFLYSTKNEQNFLHNFLQMSKNSIFNKINFQKCIKIENSNCEVRSLQNPNECLKCESGYYLENKKCKIQPIQEIANCFTYSDISTCSVCSQGYYLQSQNSCQPIEPIENCIEYQQSSSTSECSQCEKTHFVTGNQCQLRQVSSSIDFCIKYSNNADTCEECQINYVLTNLQDQCKVAIIHCQSYSNSNENECEICDEGYYYDQSKKLCASGMIQNCLKYNQFANICEQCINGFYIENGQCKKHQEINNCQIYSNQEANKCSTCLGGFFHFTQNNKCIQRSIIPHCEIYDPNQLVNHCHKCVSGYIVNDQNQCEESTDLKCLKLQNGNCQECITGYTLNSITSQCTQSPRFISEYCDSLSLNQSVYSCSECKKNYYPFQKTSYDVCLENNPQFLNQVEYCSRYTLVNQAYECQECIAPISYNPTSKTCETNCQFTKVLVLLNFQQGKTDRIRNNECRDLGAGFEQCEIASQVINDNVAKFICVKCKIDQTLKVRLNHFSLDSQNLNNVSLLHSALYTRASSSRISTNLILKTFPYNCGSQAQHTNSFNVSTNLTVVENCDLYTHEIFQDSNLVNFNLYKCQRCKMGYTGEMKNGYIENCEVIIADCDKSKEYFNLLSPYNGGSSVTQEPLSLYVSCHYCNNDKLPVLRISKETDKFQYKETTVNQVNQNHQECLSKTRNSFNLTAQDTFDTIVSNCGLILEITQMTPKADLTDLVNSNVRCAACLPGYKATYTSDMITECSLIENCDQESSKNIFYNHCGECLENHYFEYDSITKKFDYQKCVASPQSDCIIYDAQTNQCQKCDLGYHLNKDFQCEKLTFASCQSFNESSFPIGDDLRHNLFFASKGEGCSVCETEYVRNTINDSQCIHSDYLMSGQFVNTTVFIQNCEKYLNFGNQMQCAQCVEGKLLMSDKLSCVDQGTLTNCKEAQSATQCSVCVDGFVQVQGACQIKSILNCLTYDQSQAILTCQTCEDYHYLKDNQCYKGVITSCKIYQTENQCNQCEENHQLLTLQGVSYCFPFPKGRNCKVYSQDFSNGILACSECHSGYMISNNQDNFDESQCIPISVVSQCVKYDIQSTLTASSFKCQECSNNFYLKDNQCHGRLNLDFSCIEYEKELDQCKKCSLGRTLNSSKIKCVDQPLGIVNCVEYESQKICRYCQDAYYLQDNKCLSLSQDQMKPNCVAYDSSQSCVKCQSGYFLESQGCQLIEVQNCVILKDSKNCERCFDGFGLKTENESTICVQKSINMCEKSTDIFPFECLQCMPGHVLQEDKTCLTVTETIPNCHYYSDQGVCSICQVGYILNLNENICENQDPQLVNQQPYCDRFSLEKTPICSSCKIGHYFDESMECVPCQSQTLEEGCMQCDPFNPSQCLMCNFGYSQFSLNGECTKNIIEQNTIVEESSTFLYGIALIFLII